MASPITMTPIAVVHNTVTERGQWDFDNVVSDIRVQPEYIEALSGLEEFSHVLVIFWLDRAERGGSPRTHPQGREDLPLVGRFATRSPTRPNPIGITVVPLLERRGNVLRVRGLDALDGTPVLDLKPYLPGDCIPEARFPAWVHQLVAERKGQ
ncbi:MAG: tRNA (N6-threonylcarbamoyladenosine(37)-N6)-methyltransferase TrmO [Chloroflexi bacterium]|nr:tRNA (N6-threonylcarbamoyladenosine(37)-N6)-methyltransferase TrmO [Chloroflexota bacterium]